MDQERRTTAQALDVLDAALSSIDHGERTRLSPPEMVALMSRARKVQDRMSTLACVLTDEVSRAQASLAATGTPITSLISLNEGRESGDAARQVFKAHDVACHEGAKEAALSGELSSRHAVAITKGMAHLPPELTVKQRACAEEVFLRLAPKNTPKRLAQLAPQVLAEVAPELVPTVEDRAGRLSMQRRRALAKRSLAWGDDGDGSIWLKAFLPHLEAAPLIRTLEAYAETDRHAARDRLRANRATKPGPQVIRDQINDDIGRSLAQRRADALTQLVHDHRDAPNSVGDRPRIVVTVREQDLRDKAEKAGVLPSGAEITAGDLRRLCCDADLMPIVLGSASEILDVGQTKRLVTPAIRKALSFRDGGCVFPSCTATDAACEAHHIPPHPHHIRPWWAGGATSLSNLASYEVAHSVLPIKLLSFWTTGPLLAVRAEAS